MASDPTTEPRNKPIGLPILILHYIRSVIAFFVRFTFKVFYGSKKNLIPRIKNDALKRSALQLAEDIRNEKITSVELIQLFMKRNDEANPPLNYLVENRYDDALKEAAEADTLIRSGSLKKDEIAKQKPFLGVPFTTKDCIAIKGLLHTSGVVLRKDVRAEKDAKCVEYLRLAGAIPIGITNVPELCMWWESHNKIHGRTNNAYDATRIVGGSSGGEGCAQSVAGSAFGVGSDIGGSIRIPSFCNGVFGHKPSRFIVSNAGQYPDPQTELQKSFLGLGPISRHAEDLKPLLKIMSGENAAKLKLDENVDLKNVKVFYQFDNGGAPLCDPVDPEIKKAMKVALDYLSKKYNVPVTETKIERLVKSAPIWLATMKGGKSFASMIMGKDGIFNIIVEFLKYLVGLSDNTFIGIFTALFESTGCKVGDPKFNHYVEVRDHLEATFTSFLKEDGVFLYPTHPTPALYHNEPLIRPLNFFYTAIINCMGFPATHIPVGLGKEGLPIGFQVVSGINNDRLCLEVACELEKLFGGWVEPGSQTT